MKKEDLVIKLDEWINELKYEEKSKRTLGLYKSNVLKFINWIPDNQELTKDLTINYKDYLYELDPKPKTSSINTWIVELNKFLKWLDLKDLTIKKFKQQMKTSNEEILTLTDYHRLLRFAKKLNLMHLYYLMKVLAMTGIRISELRYFTVDNLKTNYIEAFNKGKERYIILRQDLARELRKYQREQHIKSGPIFINPKTKKMYVESSIWRQLKKVAGAARVNKNKVHAHSFRHLFAQIYLEENKDDIAGLADLMGHSRLDTTRIYTRTSNKQKRDKLEQLKFTQ